jgi:Ni2+-binding GTPase involved in maturation of urease and hydrogenase
MTLEKARMNGDSKTRFVLIGGFLGAGKTTLIGELARRYVAAGKRVGIITNDQADNLVDTQNLRSQGFEVGEVAGACFCCSFDDLVSTADTLGSDQAPDVLLAEPVGSCTDLVATVILPLQQLLGDRFELAPFGVILKPSHGRRILAGESAATRSGFSPQAEYIFRKQLEEADYLMIGRRDQLSDEEVATLSAQLAKIDIDVPVVAVSPRSGAGVDEVLGYIESPMTAGRKLLDIDYDTYADGEAELGWVNLTAMLRAEQEVDLDDLARAIVATIAEQIVQEPDSQIAHLKVSVLGADTQAVANIVSNDSSVDVGLAANRSANGVIQTIVNARVAIDPALLEKACRASLEAVAEKQNLGVDVISAHALRPGRPTPTHRVS